MFKVFALIALLVWSSVSGAIILPVFEPRIVEPGELFEQVIDWNRDTGVRSEIKLVSAPEGVRLTVTDDGLLMLRWQTGPDMPDETPLIIQAKDVDTHVILNTRVLVVRNAHTMAMNSPPPISAAIPVSRPVSVDHQTNPVSRPVSVNHQTNSEPPSEVSVSLDVLAGQIVSAGRALSLHVSGTTSDGQEPLINIDRLPRNATFDQNTLGTYTFFWQTADRDQGEHVFRVTAQHPADENTLISRDLKIVVGDPTRNSTLPAGPLDDES